MKLTARDYITSVINGLNGVSATAKAMGTSNTEFLTDYLDDCICNLESALGMMNKGE